MKFKYVPAMLLAALAMASCGSGAPKGDAADSEASLYLIVGHYCESKEEGIKVYEFNEDTGEARYVSGISGIKNPSFVYPSADGRFVYAVGETEGDEIPSAHVLTFDAEKGLLKLLSSKPTYGDSPCNIIVSPDGKNIYTSNYGGGSITEFALSPDGQLGDGHVIHFSGHSVHPERQTKAYLHAVNFTPDGKYLLADDLGTDRVHMFPYSVPLDSAQMQDIAVAPGTGPRHLCFSPDGRRAYLLGEISGHVITFSYDNGRLEQLQTLCADSLGAQGSGDIHCSPDGRFVYTSHRLQGDGISVLRVKDDGLLEKVGYQPTGIHPRNFAITPGGKFLVVACRDTGIQVFSRNADTGLLQPTEIKIDTPRPVCLQWIKRPTPNPSL